MNSPQNIKRLVLTAAVTSITIAGTLYGAGIKTGQEFSQQTHKVQEVTIDERISALRGMRQSLVAKKELVEKQMRDLDTRIHERNQKGLNQAKKGPPHDG